ncbi:hypothetical protein CEXT_664531 [Caerostris extrusa]|uniref:Uncharacterized protein n=1 Tax=Caerostris extrusa TaxID=172846 RepID=A0AAV4WTI4_CAEEX|nr:hypothetical protein CEXT_664531 [Caerostris extrusa]
MLPKYLKKQKWFHVVHARTLTFNSHLTGVGRTMKTFSSSVEHHCSGRDFYRLCQFSSQWVAATKRGSNKPCRSRENRRVFSPLPPSGRPARQSADGPRTQSVLRHRSAVFHLFI